jgi:pentatricopeptide repeat protein
MKKANDIFTEMKAANVPPNEVTFTTMIKGFAQSQQSEKAFQMIQQMREMKVKPNIRTYNAVLRGCFRSGDANVAIKAFQDMKHASIVPDATAVQTMIKIYAQAAMIDQAMGLLETARKPGAESNAIIDPSIYLLLAAMSSLAGIKLKTVEGLLTDFDEALKAAAAEPSTNGTGETSRLSTVASVELEFQRAQLQALNEKRAKGCVVSRPSVAKCCPSDLVSLQDVGEATGRRREVGASRFSIRMVCTTD